MVTQMTIRTWPDDADNHTEIFSRPLIAVLA